MSLSYGNNNNNTLLWQQQQQNQNTDTSETTWLNDESKESLFEKSLTPSDVGKLNRLVIPKQHAEKYFPLNGVDTSSTTSEKGMLLSFEDEIGKCWRFRYSYWNSSQSYVLTKGWSRFVKDKQLDPADVVFFQRHRSDSRRLFIGWRRRAQTSSSLVNPPPPPPYRHINYSNPPSQSEYYGAAGGTATETHSTPSSSSRTVRLFGVNLECQNDGDDSSSVVAPPDDGGYYGQNMYNYYSPHPYNMNIAFTGEQ